MELWWWALDNVKPDGALSGLSAEEIALAASWDGDAESFVAAMVDAGFIDELDGALFLHDWYDYAGKLLEKRETDKSRKRVQRMSSGRPADVQRMSSGCPTDVAGTVPNPTQPNQPKENTRRLKYDEDDYQAATALATHILDNYPNQHVTDKHVAQWADEIRRMREADKRDRHEIRAVIEWCQQDTFWRANILSAKSLRKHYDRLQVKMTEEGRRGQAGGNARTVSGRQSAPGRNPSSVDWDAEEQNGRNAR